MPPPVNYNAGIPGMSGSAQNNGVVNPALKPDAGMSGSNQDQGNPINNPNITKIGGTPVGTQTSNFSNPTTSNVSTPVVINSQAATQDLNTKKTTLDTFNTDTADHRNIVSPIQFSPQDEFANQFNGVNAEKPKNPSNNLDDQINELINKIAPGETKDTLGTEKTALDTQLKDVQNNTINSLNLLATGTYPLTPSQQSLLLATKQKYLDIINATQTANLGYQGKLKELGAVTGINKSASDQAFGLVQAAVTKGAGDVADLEGKMALSLADLQNGFDEGNYKKVTDTYKEISGIVNDRTKAIQTILDTADKAKKIIVQSSRDSAIAGLVQQGITDPSQILNFLNTNDDGTDTGGAFTAAEIGTALKNLSPNGDIDKLSGSVRDFYILKQNGRLPGNISNLPEDQQMFQYLKQLHAANTVGTNGAKITLKDITDYGFPVSTLGMSQEEITNDLYGEDVPDWFTEKIQKDTSTTTPADPKSVWDDFRSQEIDKLENGSS